MSPPRKRSNSLFRLLLWGLLAAVVLFAVAAVVGYRHYGAFADTPIAGIDAGETVMVAPGDALPTVVRKLRAVGAGGSDLEWRALARELG
ncbi:MAG: hypothetical protein IT473_05250, partial [Lysobacter sp.]|nr:hypothetical protein [Lysobacter sp.]